jgi:hypothetical protein
VENDKKENLNSSPSLSNIKKLKKIEKVCVAKKPPLLYPMLLYPVLTVYIYIYTPR